MHDIEADTSLLSPLVHRLLSGEGRKKTTILTVMCTSIFLVLPSNLASETPKIGTRDLSVDSDGNVDATQVLIDFFVLESNNTCDARNSLSTAAGVGQFTESQWLRLLRDHRPKLLEGQNRTEILALRSDCQLALDILKVVARENAAWLASQGLPVTPGRLYLVHFLGQEGSGIVFKAHEKTLVFEALGRRVVEANPFLEGKTVSWLAEWAERKMRRKK